MFIVVWLFFSLLAGAVASDQGRSFLGYFLLSLVLSPLIAIIVVLMVGPASEEIQREGLSSGTVKKCPFCAEIIKSEAIVCRYCGRDITIPPASPAKLETGEKSAEAASIFMSKARHEDTQGKEILTDRGRSPSTPPALSGLPTRMQELRELGYNTSAISEALNAEGFPLPYRHAAHGAVWTPRRVKEVEGMIADLLMKTGLR